MNLNLTKPLVVFDLETTGVNVATDRIVEIALLKILPSGEEINRVELINPTIPIPKEVAAIHGITDEMVADKPTFKEMAKDIANFIDNADLAGYNSLKFDVPLLVEEFLRADIDFDLEKRRLIDVQNIFHKMEPRTLSAAYKFYCDKELVNAHSAEADTKATFEIFKAQLDKYDTLKNDFDFLHKFSQYKKSADLMGRIVYNSQGKEVFNFGKHKGKPVEEVLEKEPSYYHWMMDGDFPLSTKRVLTKIKLRKFGA